MEQTNASNNQSASDIANLVSSLGRNTRFARFSTTLSGKVQKGVRRGDHKVEYVVLVGISYDKMLQRSLVAIDAAQKNAAFIANVLANLSAKGDTDVTVKDVQDAINGTEKGRKGLETAYVESLAGINMDSTSKHVYEPLTVNGEAIEGCKVYIGEGDTNDPTAPVPGTIYFDGCTIKRKVLQRSENGDILPGNSGPVQRAKKMIEKMLGLPVASFKTFRLLPGTEYELSCGNYAVENSDGVASDDE